MVLLFDIAHDVLEHDDGVVNDDADGEREREERHVVQCEVHRLQHREGGDDRGRNRDCGNRHRAQVSNEKEDHEAGQKAADQQVLLERRDRSVDEDRLIPDDPKRDACGKRPFDLLQFPLHRVDDFDSVGSGLPAHFERYGLLPLEHVPRTRLGEAVFDAAEV